MILGIRKPRKLCLIIFYAILALVLLQSSRYLPVFVYCPFKSLRTRISNALISTTKLSPSNLTFFDEPNCTFCVANATVLSTSLQTTTAVTKTVLKYNTSDLLLPILTVDFSSSVGVGNRMFQYAALFGIARRNNFMAMMPKSLLAKESFSLSIKYLGENIDEKSFRNIYDLNTSIYNKTMENLTKEHTRLNGQFQSYRYFNHCRTEILSEFIFLPEIITQAKNMLIKLLMEKNITWPSASIILIGLHVRRGTVLSKPPSSLGYKAAPLEYIKSAMEFYKKKYKTVQFVISSDGLSWCRKNILATNAVFINGKNPAIDMATLTLCNHTIITVGTFGWWSGFLTQGDVVYYKNWPTVNSTLSKTVNHEDLFLPNWVGL